ncbi:ROK family transcriptional regulator [Bacillus testis]|uniref:ROK family transcriptional regulator n=1 Tax=Bacillus testis TaxID=1622072 RepID=UPI00067EDDD8|nr:ROK family protein [Bacillus testis]
MKWNQQKIKIKNKQKILHTVINQAPISRADLATQLGLTKGTVSTLVGELIEEKICLESGPGESSGGRRPVILLFNEKAGYSVGIDLGVNYILGILTDLKGQIIQEQKEEMDTRNEDECVEAIINMIHSLISSAPQSPYGIVGIGIGIPGILNKEETIILAPNLGWENSNIKDRIQEAFQVPVLLENEANAGAYGEKKYGAGKNYTNVVYVSAGVGIGGGIIFDNELYRGSRGFSGEIGHMTIELNGKPCRCGNNGCWELYASEKALLNQAQAILGANEKVNLDYLVKIAEENEQIKHVFTTLGKYLGIGILNIINTFNPEEVIIGNQLASAKKWLIGPINDYIETHNIKFDEGHIKITFAELGFHSAARGVSAQTIDHFLKSREQIALV